MSLMSNNYNRNVKNLYDAQRNAFGFSSWFPYESRIFSLQDDSNLPHALTDSEILLEYGIDVLKLHEVGAYSKAQIYKGKWNNKEIAVKAIKLADNKLTRHIRNEFSVVRSITHPAIVNHYLYFRAGMRVFIVMEFVPGGTLGTYLRENSLIPLVTIQNMFRDIMSAVSYLHSMLVAHRDIKDDNIVLYGDGIRPKAKLCDFGFSVKLSSYYEKCRNYCGTRTFKSPELLHADQPYNPFKADMWACGILLYKMLTKTTPNYCTDKRKLNISKRLLNKSSTDIIEKMLKVNPDSRIDACDTLQHRWFFEVDAKELEPYL